MYVQKLYKNGNSVAVTIPKQILKQLNLRDGSKVIIEEKQDKLILKAEKKVLASDIDVKFMKMVDEFILDHKDVLEELSQR